MQQLRYARAARWLCLFGLLLAGAALADPPKGYPFVSYDKGLRLARQQGKPIFLYFGRYGCGWCAKTNQETFSDPSLRKLYTHNYVLVYVDAEGGKRLTLPSGERITEMELGARFNAFATPLFVYLKSDGTPIFKAPGYKTVKDFKQFDRYVRGGYYKHEPLLKFLKEQG
ncbi:MAG TPA: thioredoxin fold domain-containing protein [Gammaproteobacteria bacterium]|nr:thioredoxin fold domain-containing protein [Gammaproteobacteria bacterium]